MNNTVIKIIEDITSKFDVSGVERPKDNQISLDFKPEEIHSALVYVRASGFTQLSLLTCIDWIEVNEFQLVYLVFDWKTGIRMQLRCRIPRENPKFGTIIGIYPGAKYYERDVHEFFGVVFEGNPDALKQLFLENWDDMPPLRKDFNSQEYSDKKYASRVYTKDYSTKAGEKE